MTLNIKKGLALIFVIIAALIVWSYTAQQSAKEDEQVVTIDKNTTKDDEQVVTINKNTTKDDEQVVTIDKNTTKDDEQVVTIDKNTTKEDEQVVTIDKNTTKEDEQVVTIDKNTTNNGTAQNKKNTLETYTKNKQANPSFINGVFDGMLGSVK